MIPLTLTLKNFLSYGNTPQTIDFTNHHILCLSGKNGHGKSALLDAITWVLWGNARKLSGVTKPDEGLMHIGQHHMVVKLDFIVDNQTYRVCREFKISGKKGASSLYCGSLQPDGTWHSLTSKTIKETQDIIIQIVGLDFETFSTTTFIGQNQSHLFSTMSAKERKTILASILGLERYEEYKKRAQEMVKERTDTIQARNALLVHHRERLSQLAEVLEKHDTLAATTQELRNTIQEMQKTQQRYQQSAAEYTNLSKNIELLQLQQQKKEHDLAELASRLQSQIFTWRQSAQMYYAQHKEVSLHAQQKLRAAVENARKSYEAHQHLYTAYHAAEQAYTTLIMQMREAYDTQQRQQRADERALLEDIHSLEKQKDDHTRLHEEYKRLHLAHEKAHTAQEHTSAELVILTEKIAHSDARRVRLDTIGDLLTKRLHVLKLEHAAQEPRLHTLESHTNGECPVCQNVLPPEKQAALHAHAINEIARIKRLTARITRYAQWIENIAHRESIRDKQLQKELHHTQAAFIKTASEIKEIEQRLSQITKYALPYDTTHLEILITQQKKQSESTLSFEDFLKEYPAVDDAKRVRIAAQHAYDTSSYNKEEHTQLEEQLKSVDAQARLLQESKQSVHQIKADIRVLIAQMRVAKHDVRNYIDQISVMHARCGQIAAEYQAYQKLQENIHELQHAYATQERTLFEMKLHQQEQDRLQKEMQGYEQEINVLQQERVEYEHVVTAFSKDGIPALLIEQALPTIEYEANKLLQKLTDGQAYISIESLRDLKSGGAKETLDIKISDHAGSRPYEMFSGGEAFRIDFALRIAISRLLAHKSGTRVQTLIIDEGFGSQDEQGLHAMVDALTKIKDDFAKVLVVSHLPEMKEQFPVHLVVQKLPQGSVAQIVEY